MAPPLLSLPGPMARIPRVYLVEENSLNHCMWRSHNHALVLDSDVARTKFLQLLGKYKVTYGIEIHAYCLMGTHPHVICKATRGQKTFSAFWRVVNQCFARWSNLRTGGRGQVVMERLRSPRIQPGGSHELTVMRYADLNPVRAGLARSPGRWRWSSFRHYAYGEQNELLTAPAEYTALGPTASSRRKAYLHLFADRFWCASASAHVEFVRATFIGDAEWVERHLRKCGPPPVPV